MDCAASLHPEKELEGPFDIAPVEFDVLAVVREDAQAVMEDRSVLAAQSEMQLMTPGVLFHKFPIGGVPKSGRLEALVKRWKMPGGGEVHRSELEEFPEYLGGP